MSKDDHDKSGVAHCKKNLQNDTQRAVALFRQLAEPVEPSHESLISGGDILGAAGLAFIFTTRAGVGIAAMRGHGFVIRKIEGPTPGDYSWSGPIPFKLAGAGLGLALGWETVDSMLVLDKQEAVEQLTMTQGSLNFGTRLDAGIEKGANFLSAPLSMRQISSSLHAFEYSISRGAIVDFSLQGSRLHLDEDHMHAIYGAHALVADVLSGEVPAPDELAPLYQEILSLVQTYARSTVQRLKAEGAALEEEAAHLQMPAMHHASERGPMFFSAKAGRSQSRESNPTPCFIWGRLLGCDRRSDLASAFTGWSATAELGPPLLDSKRPIVREHDILQI